MGIMFLMEQFPSSHSRLWYWKIVYVSMAYTVYKSYRNKFLHCNNAAYQSKLPMKRWVKQIKVLKQKLLQMCIFTRSLRIQPLKSYCFNFLPSFVIHLSRIDLLNMPFSLNLHHGQFGRFVLRTFSQDLY